MYVLYFCTYVYILYYSKRIKLVHVVFFMHSSCCGIVLLLKEEPSYLNRKER